MDRVSFELAPSEILAVVGESGCGKSVLALSLLGLVASSGKVTGSVRLDDRELVGRPADELRRIRGREIGMVFQEPMTSLNPVHTVGGQIGEVVRRHHGLSAVSDPGAVGQLDSRAFLHRAPRRRRKLARVRVRLRPVPLVRDDLEIKTAG